MVKNIEINVLFIRLISMEIYVPIKNLRVTKFGKLRYFSQFGY